MDVVPRDTAQAGPPVGLPSSPTHATVTLRDGMITVPLAHLIPILLTPAGLGIIAAPDMISKTLSTVRAVPPIFCPINPGLKWTVAPPPLVAPAIDCTLWHVDSYQARIAMEYFERHVGLQTGLCPLLPRSLGIQCYLMAIYEA